MLSRLTIPPMGHVETMANAFAEGARSVPGVEVTLKRVPETMPTEVSSNTPQPYALAHSFQSSTVALAIASAARRSHLAGRSFLRLLAVSENHSLVVHGKHVALDGAYCHARALPLHRKFLALSRVGGLDLHGRVAAIQRDLAAARPIRTDDKGAGLDRHRVPFVLDRAWHFVPVHGHQTQPGGHGIGTVTVDPVGNVSLTGILGDGTKLTQKAILTLGGQWRLYASLDPGKGR